MLPDSGTTSHITPYAERVSSRTESNVSITLADHSTVYTDETGVQNVNWFGQDGPVNVSLSESLIAHESAVSLLSVPAPVKKGINVLFMPKIKLLVDNEESHAVIGYARQNNDGLFYISDQQQYAPREKLEVDYASVRATMAVAESYRKRPFEITDNESTESTLSVTSENDNCSFESKSSPKGEQDSSDSEPKTEDANDPGAAK